MYTTGMHSISYMSVWRLICIYEHLDCAGSESKMLIFAIGTAKRVGCAEDQHTYSPVCMYLYICVGFFGRPHSRC